MRVTNSRCFIPFQYLRYLSVIILFCFWQSAHSQVIINEISGSGKIEIKNIGSIAVDISNHWLYSFPNLRSIGNEKLICDTTFLAPGGIMAIDSFPLNGMDGELALFNTNSFSNKAFIIDFVEWGTHGHFNSRLAKEKGIWTNGDFVPSFLQGESIEYIGNGESSNSWERTIMPSICSENVIGDDGCVAEGGDISTSSNLNLCIDGSSSLINVQRGGFLGQTLWVITDENNFILENDAQMPYDFQAFGPGICFLRSISFTGAITGNEIGSNLNSIEGCFQFSNILQVNREIPNAGLVITAEGGINIDVCKDNVEIPMNFLTANQNLDYWYIVTSLNSAVIAAQNANLDSIIRLDDSGFDQCRIYGVAGSDLTMPVLGASLNSYLSFGCKAVSSNSIFVNKLVNDTKGGTITTNDQLVFCDQDNITPINVSRDTSATGDDFAWLITNASDSIIHLPDAPPFLFDTFGISESNIYSISFQGGTTGIEVGNTLSNISGCFSLSNPLTVAIEAPNGGDVLTVEGDNLRTHCSGNVKVRMTASGQASSLSYYYLITSDQDDILEIIPSTGDSTLIDLSTASEGTCRIFGWSQSGVLNPEVGQNLSQLEGGACSDISNSFVTVVKEFNPNIGGQIATTSATNICLDDVPDIISIFINGAVGDSSRWVLTDEEHMILNKDLTPPFDLNGAGIGTCTIYHISYGSDLNGLEVGENLFELENCYSLSNAIAVNRDSLSAGQIAGRDTTLQFSSCDGGVYTRLSHSGNSSLLVYSYIVSSATGIIVDVLNPEEGPVFDLSHLNSGQYRIHGWAHDGFEEALINNALLTLSDGPCQALTDTFIIVDVLPNPNDGGILTTDSPTTICIDNNSDFIDLDLEQNEGVVRISYLITDENLNIIDIPETDPPFNLDDGVPGIFLLWNLSHNGAISGFEEGNNIADIVGCFSLSNSIMIEKVLPDGGQVFSINGESNLQFCSGTINFSAAFVSSTPDLSYSYLITDESGIINQVSNAKLSSTITLNNTSEGNCRVYGWAYDGALRDVVNMSILDLETFECSSISSNFISIEKLGNANNGGVLTASNLQINCSDGIPDPIEVELIGAFGSEQSWIITDQNDNILALPPAPPFNLDPAGGGVFYIYSLSYESGLTGLTVFNNLNDLQGCYDLSNGLQIINERADAGIISTDDNLTVCTGDSEANINLTLSGEQGVNFSWLITDLGGLIQEISTDGNFDFSNAQAGNCLIWHLSYVNIIGLQVGGRIGDFDGCFDLSNSLTVTKLTADAGQVSIPDGTSSQSVCFANPIVNLNHSQVDPEFEYKYIVTDPLDNVLNTFDANSGQINISTTSSNEVRVYGWSSIAGTSNPVVGSNIISLNNGCSDLSSNFITVNKVTPDGATVVSTEGPIVSICIDGVSDPIRMFNTSNITGFNYIYLVTDLNGNIMTVVSGDFVDLDQAGVGVSLVYGYSYNDDITPVVGDNINVLNAEACGSVSSNSISITRQAAHGGMLLSDGGDIIMVCIDQNSDPVLFTPNTSSSSLPYTFVITDASNNILEFSDNRIIDFNTRPTGECRVYGWSHNGSYTPQAGDDIGSLENVSCGDLSSNFVRVIKAESGGPCTVSTENLDDYGYSLYPNPSTGSLFLKGDGSLKIDELSVFDMNGKRVQIDQISYTDNSYELDLNSLINGTYILQIQTRDQVISSKFFIAK